MTRMSRDAAGGRHAVRCALAAVAAALAAAAGVASAAGPEAASAKRSKIAAFVSILPQADIVERIGGARVEVQALVAPGQEPHTYSPTPRQIQSLSQADVYFRVGVPFEEALMPRIRDAMKGLKIVDTRRGVALLDMAEGEHEHGEMKAHGAEKDGAPGGWAAKDGDGDREREAGHGHDHGGKDPHFWLDPMRVKKMARNVCDALADLDPAGRKQYEKNFEAVSDDLEQLDGRIRRALVPFKGQEVFVFHPAYGYFCDAYGLKQVAIEAGGKEPGPKRLADLVKRAKARGVRVIFVQPQFDKKNAKTIAESIGGAVVPLDPLARNYRSNLRDMADKIARACEKKAVEPGAKEGHR
jgi:zinc transport system substrate-binding protein